MAEQHRAFFFAHSPVFVEGYFDATVIAAIQNSLGQSAEAAGSCLIPTTGKDDAGRYLMVCNALGKKGCFVFDLDALFDQRLRLGAEQDSDLASRIAEAGHGELEEMTSKLLRWLTEAVEQLERSHASEPSSALDDLRQFFTAHPGRDNLNKRRVALLVALAERRDAIRQALGKADQINGLLKAVLDHLGESDIHVLPGGALENYLPSYQGNRFQIPDSAKNAAAMDELTWLAPKRNESDIVERYGDLVAIIRKLPSRPTIDILPAIRRELSHLLHPLFVEVRSGYIKKAEQARNSLGEAWNRASNFVELETLNIRGRQDFDGVLVIRDCFRVGEHVCRFDHHTDPSNPQALRLELSTK